MTRFRLFWMCKLCCVDWVGCDVPERGEETILAWMEQTMRYVATAHQYRSPCCSAKAVDLKIPMPPGTDAIGAPVKQ